MVLEFSSTFYKSQAKRGEKLKLVQLDIGETKLEFDSKIIIEDSLPLEWYRNGINKINYSLAWRVIVQQQNPRQVANIACLPGTNVERVAFIIADEVKKVIKVIKLTDIPLNKLNQCPAKLAETALKFNQSLL